MKAEKKVAMKVELLAEPLVAMKDVLMVELLDLTLVGMKVAMKVGYLVELLDLTLAERKVYSMD